MNTKFNKTELIKKCNDILDSAKIGLSKQDSERAKNKGLIKRSFVPVCGTIVLSNRKEKQFYTIKIKLMDLQEIKKNNPALYAEIVALEAKYERAKQEREESDANMPQTQKAISLYKAIVEKKAEALKLQFELEVNKLLGLK